MVAERNSTDPVEVGISKLVGINILTENYSDVNYVSDVMTCYLKIIQGEGEFVAQYLVRAKMYLERINHTWKLSNMNGEGLKHLPLVQGLKDLHIKQRVAKEAKNWRIMDEAFNSISKHARAVERM